MFFFKWFAVFVVACFSLPETGMAGPWPRKQGSGFVQLGFSTIGYNSIYNDRAEKVPTFPDVRDNVLQVLGEVGVTDRLTVTASIPLKFLSAVPLSSTPVPVTSNLSNSGLADIDVMARYSLLAKDGYAVACGLRIGIPSGDSEEANGLVLGDGEFNIAPVLLCGRSFYPLPMYVTGDVAFNFRGNGFSNELLYNVELGYGFFDSRLYIILLLSGKESTSSVPTVFVPASVYGLSTNNQEFTALIPKVLYKFSDHLGCSVSFATATHGRNIAGGFVYAAGMFYEF